MSSAGVKVVIRTRPTASFADDCITVHDDKRSLSVRQLESLSDNGKQSWTWRYDGVLHNASQETVYQDSVAPIVQSVLQGYNGTVMCYGQTGAGKTFTLANETAGQQGIMVQAFNLIFQVRARVRARARVGGQPTLALTCTRGSSGPLPAAGSSRSPRSMAARRWSSVRTRRERSRRAGSEARWRRSPSCAATW